MDIAGNTLEDMGVPVLKNGSYFRGIGFFLKELLPLMEMRAVRNSGDSADWFKDLIA